MILNVIKQGRTCNKTKLCVKKYMGRGSFPRKGKIDVPDVLRMRGAGCSLPGREKRVGKSRGVKIAETHSFSTTLGDSSKLRPMYSAYRARLDFSLPATYVRKYVAGCLGIRYHRTRASTLSPQYSAYGRALQRCFEDTEARGTKNA
jgi:hypothetical protein